MRVQGHQIAEFISQRNFFALIKSGEKVKISADLYFWQLVCWKNTKVKKSAEMGPVSLLYYDFGVGGKAYRM